MLNETFLRLKYLKEGLSSAEIGALTFSSRATVTRKLNEFGIPLKTVTRRESGRIVYGFRQYSGKAIPVKKEQVVIKKILLLRKRRLSYRAVADELNRLQVQTKTGSNYWYPKVVRQIAMRNIYVVEKEHS